MFGVIYFMAVAALGIIYFIEKEILRRKSRDDAYKRGHMDYIDYKGRQWFGDNRAVYLYKNGKEYLVDAKNHNAVFIDITAKKKEEEKKHSIIGTDVFQKKIKEEKYHCNGSVMYSINCLFEIETERMMTIEKKQNKYYMQYKKKDGSVFVNDGGKIEISEEKYNYLKGNGGELDSKDDFLARKNFMTKTGLLSKLLGKMNNGYEINYNTVGNGFTNGHKCFLCADTEETAKKMFVDFYGNNNFIDRSSITVTQIH